MLAVVFTAQPRDDFTLDFVEVFSPLWILVKNRYNNFTVDVIHGDVMVFLFKLAPRLKYATMAVVEARNCLFQTFQQNHPHTPGVNFVANFAGHSLLCRVVPFHWRVSHLGRHEAFRATVCHCRVTAIPFC